MVRVILLAKQKERPRHREHTHGYGRWGRRASWGHTWISGGARWGDEGELGTHVDMGERGGGTRASSGLAFTQIDEEWSPLSSAGALLSALWGPNWGANSETRGDTCACS